MQVFVRRSSLLAEPVPVMMYFEDSAAITPEMRRPELALLTLNGAAVQRTHRGNVLAPGWRESNRERVVHGEATRRILAALPDHSQRNRLAEFLRYVVAHGADAAKWPRPAQERKAEIERGWNYIDAVRKAARTMANAPLPADPTADSHWPKF
jgi:hypothetical protein